MANIIYNYPKSSCECYECSHKKFPNPVGPPTNMSVRGCNFSDFYDCHTTSTFKVQDRQSNKVGHELLNPNVVSDDRHDNTFHPINVKTCPRSSCVGTTYLNSDPRLYNAAAATWMQLDKPPRNATVKLNTLTTDSSLNKYGQGYKSYADVNGGDVLYYIGKDREDAFYQPLFSDNATTVGTLYKDPMGAMLPQYARIPHEKFNPVLGDSCDVDGEVCLSFLKDTQLHREDLVSRQMSLINEQRYAPRWS